MKQRCESSGGKGESVRDGVGLVFQLAAVFGSGDDVEVDGAIFEDFDHGWWEVGMCVVWEGGVVGGDEGWGGVFTWYPSCPSFSDRMKDGMTSSFRLKKVKSSRRLSDASFVDIRGLRLEASPQSLPIIQAIPRHPNKIVSKIKRVHLVESCARSVSWEQLRYWANSKTLGYQSHFLRT